MVGAMTSLNTWVLPDGWEREPDAQTLSRHGATLESQARKLLIQAEQAAAQLNAEALRLFDASARAGSLDGLLARARLAVTDGASFSWAQTLLAEAGRRAAELSDRAAVVVAHDVLGPGLSLEGPHSEVERSPVFTVVSPYPDRAAETLHRVSGELVGVDEHGRHHADPDGEDPDGPEFYTPNYVTPVAISRYGAQIALDTKGVMWSAMGRTMVQLIADAFAADGVPVVLTGEIENLTDYFGPWEAPS
jgi:hypothetical protein